MRVESISEEQAARPLQRLHLLYHELRAHPSDYLYVVEKAQFETHVDLFARVRKAADCALWPEITFDDGHCSNIEFALPILELRGLTARFFITVGWTGKKPGYMGWPELRSLHKSGQLIGAHGWSHTLLTQCPQKDLDAELGRSRLTLEDKLGTSITTMSLPGGRYNSRVIAACQDAGYTQIYTSTPRAELEPLGLLVGRLNIRSEMTLEWIANVLQPGSGTLSRLERQHRMKAAAKTLMGDRLYERLWALLNRKEPESEMEEAAAHEDPSNHQ